MKQSKFDILFEPVQIGPVTAPNRFYAVPHATGHGWTQPSGAIALRAMKAEGGWGTVAVQMTEIAPDSDMANHPMERIWDDSDMARHRKQVEAIKAHGSLAAIELAHGGMRARNFTSGHTIIGPSALPVLRPEVPAQARAMTLRNIAEFRASHKAAALRVKTAGYDILYVYAAHDLSILSHFLSINTIQRSDAYGGSLENRVRLLREVLIDTLDVAAGERAVALRFSVAEPGRPNGLRHDGEGREVVQALAELPDLWDVNLSGWPHDSATARFSEEGFQLPYTDFVRSVTSKPVVGVGRFTSPDTMVSLVTKGRLDLIGAARPSIADPFLPNKIRSGEIESIRECIGCNICVAMDGYGLPLRCTQNPTISEEWRRGWHPENPAPATTTRSHLIVGAGPAGLECALSLLKAGQRVTLADAAAQVGGRVSREASLPGLASWARVRDYRLYQLQQSSNVDLFLSSPLTASDIGDFDADTVTIATGAKWRNDGVGRTNFEKLSLAAVEILSPDDIMDSVADGRLANRSPMRALVYDDDHFYMANSIAEHLVRAGHGVTYVTPLPSIATWTDYTLDQERIIERLNALGVNLFPNLRLLNGARFENVLSGDAVELDPQIIVFVGARIPVDDLYAQLNETMAPDRLFLTGDCVTPGIIQAAVLSGHQTARGILAGSATPPAIKREQILF